MSMEEDNRETSWWQTGVSPDRQATVGWSMMRTVIVWLAVVLVLLAAAAIVVAIV